MPRINRTASRRGPFPVAGLFVLLIIAIFVVAIVVSLIGTFHKKHIAGAKITDKGTHCSGSTGHNKCQYLIYTTQGVFKDTDAFLHWKFNSSDIYGQLIVGHTYDLTVTGFRIPFTSSYPNILSYKEDK